MKKLVMTLALSVLLVGCGADTNASNFTYAQYDKNGIIIKESIAQIDCTGLSRETDGKDDFLMVVTSPYKRCMEYNRGEPFHVSADRFMKNRSPDMDFTIRPDYFQEYKTDGRIYSEEDGLYNLIYDYGLELGLIKIKAFFVDFDFIEAYPKIEYHMKHTPAKIIAERAKEFPYSESVKKFLAKSQTLASN